MNYQQLNDYIRATPECVPLIVDGNSPKQDASVKDQQIADICNKNIWKTDVVDTFIDVPGLLRELGGTIGATILDKLEAASSSSSILKWAFFPLKTERGLNIGDPETQAFLDSIDGSVLTSGEVSAIKSIAVKPIVVTGRLVSIALRGNAEFTPI